MLNVNRITAVLERLPDAELQKYAAMHKQDPYVLSLAVEESNRRKRMRAAPPPGQPQGEAPPVNEQVVQGMAPEDVGIAQLPTTDMNFADGGIVAFSAGGATSAADARLIEREQDEMGRGLRAAFSPAAQAALTRIQTEQDQARSDYLLREQGLMRTRSRQAAAAGTSAFGPMQSELPAPANLTPSTKPAPPVAEGPIQGPPAGLAGLPAAGNAAAPATPTPDPAAQPLTRDLARIVGASSGAGMQLRTPRAAPNLAERYQSYLGGLSNADPAEAAREEARTTALAAHEANVKQYEADRPKGLAYERREAQLKKEEGEAGAKKEENFKMALVNAGLGMLAGTSRYAAVNIGEGAKQGVKSFAEGKEKLEKAAERRQELFDKIEEARRAEQRGEAEKALALRKEAAAIDQRYRDSKVSAIMETYKVNREVAGRLADASVRFDIASMQEEGANARTAASVRSQEATLMKTAIMGEVRMLDTELSKIVAQLNANPLMAKTDATGYATLMEQKKELERSRLQLSNALRAMIPGMPKLDARGAAGAGAEASGGQRMKFDAKGDLIK